VGDEWDKIILKFAEFLRKLPEVFDKKNRKSLENSPLKHPSLIQKPLDFYRQKR
jgi:hypothetical protein